MSNYFCWQTVVESDGYVTDYLYDDVVLVQAVLSHLSDNYYAFDTYFVERGIKISNISTYSFHNSEDGLDYVAFTCDSMIQARPKSFNPALAQYILMKIKEDRSVIVDDYDYNILVENDSDVSRIRDILTQNLLGNNNLFIDVDSVESYFAGSFCVAILMDNILSRLMDCERNLFFKNDHIIFGQSVQLNDIWVPLFSDPSLIGKGEALLYGATNHPGVGSILNDAVQVTNLDFVQIASGYDAVNDSFPYNFRIPQIPIGVKVNNTNLSLSGNIYHCYTNALISVILNESIDPIHSPFLPYRNGKEQLKQSRFTIKSDSTNRLAFKKFMETLIIVIIVATLAITTTVLIKKLVRRIRINNVAKQGDLDNYMWSGGRLTNAQAKKYFRLQRKNEGTDNVVSGLLSSFSSYGDNGSDFNQTALGYLNGIDKSIR